MTDLIIDKAKISDAETRDFLSTVGWKSYDQTTKDRMESGWVYRDMHTRLGSLEWNSMYAALGESEKDFVLLAGVAKDNYVRGQFLLSPNSFKVYTQYFKPKN